MIEELTAIAEQMEGLLPRFVDHARLSGKFLQTEDATTFRALAVEAKVIFDEELGRLNDYSQNLIHTANSKSGLNDGPSYDAVEQASKIVLAGIRTVRRRHARPPAGSDAKSYVDPTRIGALQGIGSGKWDFARLVELCREINVAAANRCHLTTAMLLRTILNHVPPVLGFATFSEVANNYGGPKEQRSFKAAMQRLEGAARSIADFHLHSPIREREDVPTFVQVDFAAELDVLLGEVIRVARSAV